MAMLDAPIPRRRALRVIGGGVLVTGAGLVVVACGGQATAAPTTGASVWVPVDVDLTSVPVGTPTSISLAIPAEGSRPAIDTSAWLLRESETSLVVYDPRCTHLACVYSWMASEDRFDCHCHQAAFSKAGDVLFGPPPRPLDRLATRVTNGRLEVEVPAGFGAPVEEL